MHKTEVAELVGRTLSTLKVEGVSFLVPDAQLIYQENDYWHIPIAPSQDLPSLFPAMEELARIEGNLADEYHLRLVLHLVETTFGREVEQSAIRAA